MSAKMSAPAERGTRVTRVSKKNSTAWGVKDGEKFRVIDKGMYWDITCGNDSCYVFPYGDVTETKRDKSGQWPYAGARMVELATHLLNVVYPRLYGNEK